MFDPVSIGRRIGLLRRSKGYTQEQLSLSLNVTPQAISKWETGNSLPDTALLPLLAKALEVSIDHLLTGKSPQERTSPYDKEYERDDYYWGLQPSTLAEQVVLLVGNEVQGKRVLDLGSGEGRDSIYFAKLGFTVDSLEISTPGVEKIKKYSQHADCQVNIIHADMIGFPLSNNYDVIYSMGSLQFLPLELRQKHFDDYKRRTLVGGLNAHLVFVEKPFIEVAPDWEKNEFFYTSGDLARFYYDWEIIYCEEQIIPCNSANIPHRHAISSIIARKVT